MLRARYEKFLNGDPDWSNNLTEAQLNYLHLYLPDNLVKDRSRKQQLKFRQDVLEKYEECFITGFDAEECDACHIIPHEKGGSFKVDNGILLCKNLHYFFDKGYWTIKEGKILLSPQIQNKKSLIKQYEGFTLEINKEMENNLIWHYKNIFQK